MANEMKLAEDSTPVKLNKENEITVVVKTDIDEESYSNCKKKIEKLNEELKNAKSTIKDIDNAIKELKILLEYCSQDNEERNK